MKHLVIMAAGTGGHIMPGLAIASEMKKRGWSVSWLGTTKGMENQLVPAQGIPMDTLAFSGLRGKGLVDTLLGGWRLLVAFVQCFRMIGQRQANVVLGMGGYVCLPGGVMASLRGKPLMLVNADAQLLLSNKVLLPLADTIALGFDGPQVSALNNRHRTALATGNPVREEIQAIPAPEVRFAARTGPLRVLVVGGSLGAMILNETLPKALASIPADKRPCVIHQTGNAHIDAVRAGYDRVGIEIGNQVQVLPFIINMSEQLSECDVIICRAGAITVSELCSAGVASILVPLVISTTTHQRDNAKWMASHQAAIHLPQAEMTAETLAKQLQSLQRSELLLMARQAKSLARNDAVTAVAEEIERLSLREKQGRA